MQTNKNEVFLNRSSSSYLNSFSPFSVHHILTVDTGIMMHYYFIISFLSVICILPVTGNLNRANLFLSRNVLTIGSPFVSQLG